MPVSQERFGGHSTRSVTPTLTAQPWSFAPQGRWRLTGNLLVAYRRFVEDNLDAVFKALADRTRRLVLDRLRERDGLTLAELCERLSMTRQAVSKHVALLEAAGLVVSKRR